ncbi:MAG: G8 domain-containing protein [Cyanobacteria bacterium J06626_18]
MRLWLLILGFFVAIALSYPSSAPLNQTSEPTIGPAVLVASSQEAPAITTVAPSTPKETIRWSEQFADTTADTEISIPANLSVRVDVPSIQAKSITVEGELLFSDTQDVEVATDWLQVVGPQALLQAGTEDQPFTHNLTLTLQDPRRSRHRHGESPKSFIDGHERQDDTAQDYKGLVVKSGARLDLHGISREKVAWTQLAQGADAQPGDTTLQLATPVNWVTGDRIVIAPSGFDPYEDEAVTLTSVSSDGKTVTFTPPLEHRHVAIVEQHENALGEPVELDMRAEVGLLSRNITIQGDEASDEFRYGAHAMFLYSQGIHIEGTRFYRCGQQANQSRYCIHWHRMIRDIKGDYLHYKAMTQLGRSLNEKEVEFVSSDAYYRKFSSNASKSNSPSFLHHHITGNEAVQDEEFAFQKHINSVSRPDEAFTMPALVDAFAAEMGREPNAAEQRTLEVISLLPNEPERARVIATNHDYIRNSSIEHSYQRCVNVHGSKYVTVDNTICYDVRNHGIAMAEDGNEMRNQYTHNLVVRVTAPDKYKAENAFAADSHGGGQEEETAACFWGESYFNQMVGNHCAGVEGGGGFHLSQRFGGVQHHNGNDFCFAYDTFNREGLSNNSGFPTVYEGDNCTPGLQESLETAAQELGLDPKSNHNRVTAGIFKGIVELPYDAFEFRDNVAHSISVLRTRKASDDRIYKPAAAMTGFALFARGSSSGSGGKASLELNKQLAHPFTFEDFTAYKLAGGGLWVETGATVKNLLLSDFALGYVPIGSNDLDNAVFIGESSNTVQRHPEDTRQMAEEADIKVTGILRRKASEITAIHLQNVAIGGISNPQMMLSNYSNVLIKNVENAIRLTNTKILADESDDEPLYSGEIGFANIDIVGDIPGILESLDYCIRDIDGSLTGTPNTLVNQLPSTVKNRKKTFSTTCTKP